MLIKSVLSICMSKKIGLNALKLLTHVIELTSSSREFRIDGAATANARSPSVALDFTDS